MPIYAYRCGSCGHAKDVLQKISDAPLTVCPSCGAPAFSKQLTAAGFQLKGTAGMPPISAAVPVRLLRHRTLLKQKLPALLQQALRPLLTPNLG